MYMISYLNNRKQLVNVNNTSSAWESIIACVPQGSILEPLLWNIFLSNLFLFVTNSGLNNYADDNTLYCFSDGINDVNQT